jgi:osmotically-inducible protein OsmY
MKYMSNPMNKRVCMLVCFVTVMSGLSVFSEDQLKDAEISAAINADLIYDSRVMANKIDVECLDGVVTLSGTVNSILDRERAENFAAATVGVRSIINLIRVDPRIAQTDAQLTELVRGALARDPAADAFEVKVDVQEGVVTLKGRVESYAEKDLSADVAKNTVGVKEVRNRILVENAVQRSDSEIKADVVARLENDVRVDDHLIMVAVTNGQVFLSGSVGSLQEQFQADADAWVSGVKAVDIERLEVNWWNRDKMRRALDDVPRPDVLVTYALKSALEHDPRVNHQDIEIIVDNGVVSLGGVVSDLRAKDATLEDARNTTGVWRVIDGLKVRPKRVNDDELKQRVVQKLNADSLVNRAEINVDVDDGWVTLRGEVNTSYEKTAAELAVRAVKGVAGVKNRLVYERVWVWMPDFELEEAVTRQLYWSAFTDSDDIRVQIQNGLVTLTGTVDSWTEYYDAEKNAYQAGAKHVENELEVSVSRHIGPYGPGYLYPTLHSYAPGYGW